MQNKVRIEKAKKEGLAITACEKEGDCSACPNTLCGGKTFTTESIKREKEEE